ncbi:MAG: aconitate hydratase AcnA [Chloroflexi bacterium]|nr:aconitate hydratase AcnA [Chloroflexota bacterium]
MTTQTQFGARTALKTPEGNLSYYRLGRLQELGVANLDRTPYCVRIVLESLLRNMDGKLVFEEDVLAVAKWDPKNMPKKEVPFMPSRVLMQDLTGVPAIVDLASMRSAMKRLGGDPKRVNPLVPVDLVIDHSVQVDYFGASNAFALNVAREYERNTERYGLLRWAQQAFQNTRIVPPGTGICHQVNLEYLSSVVSIRKKGRYNVALPDTLVGMDSHTTMVNGLGVLGWGVGGIEAEAVMVGQPYYMLMPPVVGVKLTGALRDGVTATDLVLTVTQLLRKHGVVNKFVEFYGPGLARMPLADRATISNMSPEYGATCGLFPVDNETLSYLRGSGRDPKHIRTVEDYCKANNLFYSAGAPEPDYNERLELDMSTVESSLAGPARPQDRVRLGDMKSAFQTALANTYKKPAHVVAATPASSGGAATAVAEHVGAPVRIAGQDVGIDHGAVVIAAISSCTNTSNPSVMIGAGILAKNAVGRGLRPKPWVKTSMAPGSQVVDDYLANAGVLPYLEALGFHIVGHGCTTCIGNSGPLPEAVGNAVSQYDIVSAAVVSSNRNFEARVHPQVKANYLASPMLVVAFAIAGRVDIDLEHEPLGQDPNGQPVYLRDIWPSQDQISRTVTSSLNPDMFKKRYGAVFEGDEKWRSMPVPTGDLYVWDPDSTYVKELPIFNDFPPSPAPLKDISGARVLAALGDSVTTDHISPASDIDANSPAGQYLQGRGIQKRDFNTYGARRGHDEVLTRGTFANIRLKNALAPGGKEGWYTVHLPDKKETSIFEASAQYKRDGVPLIIFGGKEYGQGSSRDWAAKGPVLLGVKAVIVESFERIHRTNLIGMCVLHMTFMNGQNSQSLGLTGYETYDIKGIADDLKPGKVMDVTARKEDGSTVAFKALARLDTPIEVEYYRHGGVLQYVVRNMLKGK